MKFKRKNPDAGAIEILCEEIGYPFDRSLERHDLLVRFVGVLVGHVEHMREIGVMLAGKVTSAPPSHESGVVLAKVKDMLLSNDTSDLTRKCEEIHTYIHTVNPDDAYPTDHLIDMLSSCVSAVRFGIEPPCKVKSRHAASAANHIWEKKYGISLFDGCTSAWQEDWARQQLQTAVVSLLPPPPSKD